MSMIALAATGAADIATFTGFATSVLTWFITTFGTILTFMISNPIAFIGLIVSLIVTAIGMLRHIIGG